MTYAHAEEARLWLQRRLPAAPAIGVVLGSGLEGLAAVLADAVEVPYSEIPHWPCSTAPGHAGRLAAGRLGEKTVAVLAGRVHLYEGYSAAQVAFPVRVLGLLGVRTLLLTNAAGAVNPAFRPGQMVLISDHLNLQGANPLSGPTEPRLGSPFVDLSEVYSPRLRETARRCAARLGFQLGEGVYAALAGPAYETPAEIRYLRAIGADLVGMSTVPEAIAAAQMGIEVLGISCVSNMAAGLLRQKLSHEEVLEAGRKIRGVLVALLQEVIAEL
jgi:purine-nucleoside phosphorylase